VVIALLLYGSSRLENFNNLYTKSAIENRESLLKSLHEEAAGPGQCIHLVYPLEKRSPFCQSLPGPTSPYFVFFTVFYIKFVLCKRAVRWPEVRQSVSRSRARGSLLTRLPDAIAP
jgi:hypothetical protein